MMQWLISISAGVLLFVCIAGGEISEFFNMIKRPEKK